jgi:type IV pilus assembly protein PilX
MIGIDSMSTVRSHISSRFVRAQRGAALVTSLLLLLVLTIIGVTAMQMTRMQERMSGNARDLNLAFQGAEAAVRDGEALIRVQPGTPDNCSTLPCEFWQANLALMTTPETRDWNTWWRVYANEYEDAGGNPDAPIRDMPQLAEDPRYVVQYITRVPDSLTVGEGGGAPPGRDFYQVTGRSLGGVPVPTATGQPNPAMVVVQSTFARR